VERQHREAYATRRPSHGATCRARPRHADVRPLPRTTSWLVLLFVLAASTLTPLSGAQTLPTGAAEPPDLVITADAATYTHAGEDLKICTHALNIGDGPSVTPFTLRLSFDGYLVSDKRVSESLQRGQATKEAACWTLKANAGQHTYVLTVDAQNEVKESKEDNNVRAANFYLRPVPRPDWRIIEFYVSPEQGSPGDSQFFVVNVANYGDAPAPETTVSVYRTVQDKLVDLTLPTLAPGRSARVGHVVATDLMPSGTWAARATVDPLNTTLEWSEANEALTSYRVPEHPTPDITVENFTIAGDALALSALKVGVDVNNTGDRTARDVVVHILNQSDVILAESFPMVVQPGLPNHTLRAVADPSDAVFERNETNNDQTLNITVLPANATPRRPNLVVERIDILPSDPAPGERVTLLASVRNIGQQASPATNVTFFVDDEMHASGPLTRIPPNALATVPVGWQAPAEGIYRLRAVVAAPANETSLSDNELRVDFTVTTPPEPTPETTQPSADELPPNPNGSAPPTPPTDGADEGSDAPTDATPGGTTESRTVAITDLAIITQPKPGAAAGVMTLVLRNPLLEPVQRVSVTFFVDDKEVAAVLVSNIPGAGTTPVTSGEVDLPAGSHDVRVDARILEAGAPTVSRTGNYAQEAGARGVPAPGALSVIALVATLAGLVEACRRRRP